MDDSRRTDILIVGAGPAGLATAACLHRLGVAPTVVERASTVAACWSRHYDRLHLHTTKRGSALPFTPWPRGLPRYPSRDRVVDYFAAYAPAHGIRPRFGVDVRRIARDAERFAVETSAGRLAPRWVVVATGANAVPVRAALPGLDAFAGRVVHSSGYRRAADLAGLRTLVVGCGNSGAEIALDLAEHGVDVAMAVRGPVHIVPRAWLGVSTQALGIALSGLPAAVRDALVAPVLRSTIGDLSRFGIERPRLGPYRTIERTGRIPVLDVGTVATVRAGRISIRPAIDAVLPDAVRFAGGRVERFEAIILATGYRPGLESLVDDVEALVDARGQPRCSGREGPVDGLFFVGFRSPATGALREIGIEARRVAAAIAARLR